MSGPAMLSCTGAHSFLEYQIRAAALFGSQQGHVMDKPRAQTSMRLLHIAYHDFEGIADNVDERERLVRDLSDHEAMILRNHGLLVVGRTVPAAFNVLFLVGTRLSGAGDGFVLQYQADRRYL
jgi:ribulose-5-phosphate 4-epimerase/fuculose-1-phosphate aldolase